MASLSLFGHFFTNFPGGKVACRPIELTPGGTIIYGNVVRRDIQGPVYLAPYCPMGSVYIYDLSRLFRSNFHILTASTQAWQDIYTVHSGYASSIPVFISIISFALVMTVAMAVFMSISRHSRFPLSLRLAVYFSTAETMAIFGIMLRYLYNRHRIGGNAVSLTVLELVTKPHRVASFVASTLLQLCLIRVAIQLFQRDIERKCVAVCGTMLVIASVILSGFSNFTKWHHPMLNAFHYLIEMSVYLLFGVCMSLRGAESWEAALSKDLMMLTFLTFSTIWLPPALYVAEFYGWWHARMIDQLCPFTTVMCVVLGWYWVQKICDMEQTLADGRQLGRRMVNGHPQMEKFRDNSSDYENTDKVVKSCTDTPKSFWGNISMAHELGV